MRTITRDNIPPRTVMRLAGVWFELKMAKRSAHPWQTWRTLRKHRRELLAVRNRAEFVDFVARQAKIIDHPYPGQVRYQANQVFNELLADLEDK